jgi:hypothetical protein
MQIEEKKKKRKRKKRKDISIQVVIIKASPGAPFAFRGFVFLFLLVLSPPVLLFFLHLSSHLCENWEISWGRQTGRGQVACTCSKHARRWLQWCSRARRDRLRRLEILLEDISAKTGVKKKQNKEKKNVQL